MIVNPLTPIEMETMENYLVARIQILKANRDKVDPFEQADLYTSISSVIDELEYTVKLFTKRVVNNQLSETIVDNTISKANGLK
jgi:hypothetical protein